MTEELSVEEATESFNSINGIVARTSRLPNHDVYVEENSRGDIQTYIWKFK